MSILGLDHINITGPAALIERCRSFYVDVLGLVDGERPSFRNPGFWLYAGDRPIVHLTIKERDLSGTTAVDHFAFRCAGLEETMTSLRERGIAFELDPARDAKAAQLFLTDPAGVSLELNF